jgi:hypothetical protein
VQAHWIAQKVIKGDGGIKFLGNKLFDKGIHCDVCKDFNDTIKGLARHVKEYTSYPVLFFSIVIVKLIAISIVALAIPMTVNALLVAGPVQTGTTATQVQQCWIHVRRKSREN